MRPDPDDTEIRAYVLASGLPTARLIARAVEATFGPERAWPVALVRTIRADAIRPGRRDRYQDNPAILAFIADHAEQCTLNELLESGRAIFGEKGFPSRSHLHRIVSESRTEARIEATLICGREIG